MFVARAVVQDLTPNPAMDAAPPFAAARYQFRVPKPVASLRVREYPFEATVRGVWRYGSRAVLLLPGGLPQTMAFKKLCLLSIFRLGQEWFLASLMN